MRKYSQDIMYIISVLWGADKIPVRITTVWFLYSHKEYGSVSNKIRELTNQGKLKRTKLGYIPIDPDPLPQRPLFLSSNIDVKKAAKNVTP